LRPSRYGLRAARASIQRGNRVLVGVPYAIRLRARISVRADHGAPVAHAFIPRATCQRDPWYGVFGRSAPGLGPPSPDPGSCRSTAGFAVEAERSAPVRSWIGFVPIAAGPGNGCGSSTPLSTGLLGGSAVFRCDLAGSRKRTFWRGRQAFGLDQGDAEPAGAPSWGVLDELGPSAPEITSRPARLSSGTCWA